MYCIVLHAHTLTSICAQCWSACFWVCIQQALRATTSGLICTLNTPICLPWGPPKCSRCSSRCRATRSSRLLSASAPPPSSAAGSCARFSHASRPPALHLCCPLRMHPLLRPTQRAIPPLKGDSLSVWETVELLTLTLPRFIHLLKNYIEYTYTFINYIYYKIRSFVCF